MEHHPPPRQHDTPRTICLSPPLLLGYGVCAWEMTCPGLGLVIGISHALVVAHMVTCTLAHTHTCTHTFDTHTHTYTLHTHICTFAHTPAHLHTHICTFAHTHTCTLAHTHLHTHTFDTPTHTFAHTFAHTLAHLCCFVLFKLLVYVVDAYCC